MSLFRVNNKPFRANGINLKIRSAWTPADIITSLWLDATDASTITEQTGVSQWNSKSGDGNFAAMGVGGDQPTWDGVKALTFDASDGLILDSQVVDSDCSMFVLMKTSDLHYQSTNMATKQKAPNFYI